MNLQLLPSGKDNVHVLIYIQKAKNCEMFLYAKSQTISKKQDNFCYVLIYQKRDTMCHAILHKNFEIGIFIKKV